MRRFFAAIAMCSLANLTLVRGAQACSATGERASAPAAAAAEDIHPGHEGHVLAPADESPQPAPAGDHDPVNQCLTMSTCAVTLAVQLPGTVTGPSATSGDRVIGLSDRQPRSWKAAPELPPPRA